MKGYSCKVWERDIVDVFEQCNDAICVTALQTVSSIKGVNKGILLICILKRCSNSS